MRNPIAVVGEARGDFEVASRLIDETLIRTVGWIDRDEIHTHREYVGLSDAAEFLTWQAVENSRGSDYRRAERRHFGDGLPTHDVHVRIRRVIYEFTIRSGEADRRHCSS
jgi:hypothetical protein